MKKLIFGLLLLMVHPVFAWNTTGHLVIAQIAYDQLTPQAQNQVNQLVAVFAKTYPQFNTFELMADWPDELRGQGVTAFNQWHFINRPLGAAPKWARNQFNDSKEDNVVWAIQQSEAVLKSTTAAPFTQAMFLAFLAHFVGDVHQPLHGTNFYSKRFPEGDRGGNFYKINSDIATNLHGYWDEGAGFYQRYRPDEALNMNGIKSLAVQIQKDYPPSYFQGKQEKVDPNAWSIESYDIAKRFVYQAQYGQAISKSYQTKAQAIAEQQTALAGYRLAAVLNQLYTSS